MDAGKGASLGLPVESIPEELMFPQRKREMIAWLSKQLMPGEQKSRMLSWWARWVGIRLTRSEYQKVFDSGL